MCLMFDMREDGDADPCKLVQMMQKLGVFISVKPKVKQNSKVKLCLCCIHIVFLLFCWPQSYLSLKIQFQCKITLLSL